MRRMRPPAKERRGKLHHCFNPRLVPVSNVIFSSKADILSKIAMFINFIWSSSRLRH